MGKVLIKNGILIDPLQKINGQRDILLQDEKVLTIGKNLTVDDKVEIVDAKGKTVLPGLIDLHVHLREPGQEGKETIASGCTAAIHGGFTTIACMPNTIPVADSGLVINYINNKVRDLNISPRVYPIGAITRESKGEELAEMAIMQREGIKAVSDDGKTVTSALIMAQAMKYATSLGLKVISHCEEDTLARGHMNEGLYATKLGLEGIPNVSESLIVARDILLSEYTGCPLHIAHVSTAESVELITRAKEKGLSVTAEVTPHHLVLTEEAVGEFNTDFKMNPPLRSEKDVETIRKALKEGIIDCIATDHAPHTMAEKEVEFASAPFGVVGLETALPIIITELVLPGLLTLEDVVHRLSIAPARILGIDGGTLKEGSIADITILDMKTEKKVDKNSFHSKGRNTPFEGRTLKGWPVMTVVRGQVVEVG